MNNVLYGKAMEHFRNRIDVKLVSNDLVAIHKNKVTLGFSKLAYIGMCILELSKVSMDKFHYDYIKNKYYSQTLNV